MLYKIGDFSKTANASIRTLRYYDEIDLFKPKEINLFTGYRYYSQDQIEEFEIIRKLQEVGFTLDEIKLYYNNFDDSIMLKKKSQLLENIKVEKEKIRKIDYLRSNIIDGKFRFNRKEAIDNNRKKTLYNLGRK